MYVEDLDSTEEPGLVWPSWFSFDNEVYTLSDILA